MKATKELYTLKELAKMSGVPASTIGTRAALWGFGKKVGGRRFFYKSEIKKLTQHYIKPGPKTFKKEGLKERDPSKFHRLEALKKRINDPTYQNYAVESIAENFVEGLFKAQIENIIPDALNKPKKDLVCQDCKYFKITDVDNNTAQTRCEKKNQVVNGLLKPCSAGIFESGHV